MTVNKNKILDGVSETLLITLYIRALESQRKDALIKDDKAVALVKQYKADFSRYDHLYIDDLDQASIILRNLEFDRHVEDFLERHPNAVVVHIGCGLDSRFERVDNGSVEWYDLDLPEVIDLRREFVGAESERYHFLPYSAFDTEWQTKVSVHSPQSFLFVAEGVFMYFRESQVKFFVLMLRDRFPNSELVFDAFSPYIVFMNNLRFRISRTKINARYEWGLKREKDLERWGDGITLLDTWFPFDRPEPRLAKVQWMRHIPLFARVLGIFHYRLGTIT